MKLASLVRMMHWSWWSQSKMEGQCLAMMTAVKLEVRSLQYDSSGERTFITKGTCTIYDIHILMEPITTQELSMRHITSHKDARRMYWFKASKVMVCCLCKVDNDGTCQMYDAIVVNKWDTMQTHRNVPTINQIQTKVMSQAMQLTRERHKVGME